MYGYFTQPMFQHSSSMFNSWFAYDTLRLSHVLLEETSHPSRCDTYKIQIQHVFLIVQYGEQT